MENSNAISDSNQSSIQEVLTQAFAQINDEFSDHLQAINDNTNEIQSNYEYLCELDEKIEKLSERVDEIAMLLRRANLGLAMEKTDYDIKPLNPKEKEVFLALYSLETELGAVTYHDISHKLSLPVSLVQAYMTNLFGKGVPLQKRYRHNKVYLSLDPEFRDYQARMNVIGITESISQRIQD